MTSVLFRTALLGLALTLVSCVTPAERRAGIIEESGATPNDRLHWVPVTGTDSLIQMRLCRPSTAGEAPLVVINHGSPVSAQQRTRFVPEACDHAATRWFLDRGYAVAFPLRRGYGASGGEWAESYQSCQNPNFVAAAQETARDTVAAITYTTTLVGIARDGVIVVGQSAGGWGALGLAAQNPGRVTAFINMAGGRGGRQNNQPNTNCRADMLAAAAGRLGQTARLPSLWVYAANDSFFGPNLALAMHQAYVQAGGVAEFHALPAFGADGHGLFFASGGPAIWGPLVERFLAATRR